MSSLRRHKNSDEATSEKADYLDAFLAQPADVGTRVEDIEAVAKADADGAAERARMDAFLKTEEAFDRNAPRPSVINDDF
jgi:hypothetical protein